MDSVRPKTGNFAFDTHIESHRSRRSSTDISQAQVKAPGEPVFTGKSSFLNEGLPSAPQPLSTKKVEAVSVDEGDYFLIRFDSNIFDPDVQDQEEISNCTAQLERLASEACPKRLF